MTAALPADLTERVLEVVGAQRASGRSVIFISHRLIEISALCDRATVLRDGETVGVVDMTPGRRGPHRGADARPSGRGSAPAAAARPADGTVVGRALPEPERSAVPRLSVDGICAPGTRLDGRLVRAATRARSWASWRSRGRARTSCSRCSPGPGAQTAASSRSTASRRLPPPCGRHPRGPRVRARRPPGGAPAAALGAREHRAAVLGARPRLGSHPTSAPERRIVDGAIARLQIDTRAQSEVRRLSGGNQQKVTIARWIATGVRTLLCFDPTRGIDIRTKRQIYHLLRELAAPARRSCCTPRSWRRSSWPATGRSSSSAVASWTRCRPPTPTSRPSCARPTAAAGRADARGGRRGGHRRALRALAVTRRQLAVPPATSAHARPRSRWPSVATAGPSPCTLLAGAAARAWRASTPGLRAGRPPVAGHRRCCRSPSRPRPRRWPSSRAASTCPSAP